MNLETIISKLQKLSGLRVQLCSSVRDNFGRYRFTRNYRLVTSTGLSMLDVSISSHDGYEWFITPSLIRIFEGSEFGAFVNDWDELAFNKLP